MRCSSRSERAAQAASPKGRSAVDFTYDILGRTKTAVYSDGRTLTYTYTGDGQLYSILDSVTGYTYLYTYDNIGRLIASSVLTGGNLVMQTRQEYNYLNQLVTQSWQIGSAVYSQSYSYHSADGALRTASTGSGHTLIMEYDGLRRLSKVDTPLLDRNYSYVAGGESGQTTGLVHQYWYGSTLTSTPFNYTYTYDALGNIATYKENSTTYSFTYGDFSQRSSIGVVSGFDRKSCQFPQRLMDVKNTPI